MFLFGVLHSLNASSIYYQFVLGKFFSPEFIKEHSNIVCLN